ncbi:MAG: flagellar basal body-associated FliL family protein [bacterium]|nr:flagellar basal body-associated FliL family protein [bacterium]
MAADEDKTKIEASGKEGDEAAATEKKKGKKLFLFGGIGIAAIAVGVVLAMFVVKPMMSADAGDGTEEAVQEDSHAKKESHSSKKKSGHGEGGGSESLVYAIKDIVINPAGTGGTRFLSVSLGFEVESAEILAEFEARDPIVRDALITILSSKTVAQLTDFKQKEIIRYQIKKKLEKVMSTDQLAGVYYTDFVLQ